MIIHRYADGFLCFILTDYILIKNFLKLCRFYKLMLIFLLLAFGFFAGGLVFLLHQHLV